jgi:hypothetical protein
VLGLFLVAMIKAEDVDHPGKNLTLIEAMQAGKSNGKPEATPVAF